MNASEKGFAGPCGTGKGGGVFLSMPITLPVKDEVTTADIAAVEAVLRHIDQSQLKGRFFAGLANWFLVFKMFKEFEIAYTLTKDRAPLSDRHRALLTAVLGMGECFAIEAQNIPDADFKKAGYAKSTITANVRYLRDKYAQWFHPVDDGDVLRVGQIIENARATASA